MPPYFRPPFFALPVLLKLFFFANVVLFFSVRGLGRSPCVFFHRSWPEFRGPPVETFSVVITDGVCAAVADVLVEGAERRTADTSTVVPMTERAYSCAGPPIDSFD